MTPRLSRILVTGFGRLSPDTVVALCPCVGVTYFRAPGLRKYSTSTSAAADGRGERVYLPRRSRLKIIDVTDCNLLITKSSAEMNWLPVRRVGAAGEKEKTESFFTVDFSAARWYNGMTQDLPTYFLKLLHWSRLRSRVGLLFGRYCLTTVVKLFTPLYFCQQAV